MQASHAAIIFERTNCTDLPVGNKCASPRTPCNGVIVELTRSGDGGRYSSGLAWCGASGSRSPCYREVMFGYALPTPSGIPLCSGTRGRCRACLRGTAGNAPRDQRVGVTGTAVPNAVTGTDRLHRLAGRVEHRTGTPLSACGWHAHPAGPLPTALTTANATGRSHSPTHCRAHERTGTAHVPGAHTHQAGAVHQPTPRPGTGTSVTASRAETATGNDTDDPTAVATSRPQHTGEPDADRTRPGRARTRAAAPRHRPGCHSDVPGRSDRGRCGHGHGPSPSRWTSDLTGHTADPYRPPLTERRTL